MKQLLLRVIRASVDFIYFSFFYAVTDCSFFQETFQFWFWRSEWQLVFSYISLVLLECSCWHYLVAATMGENHYLNRASPDHYASLTMAFSMHGVQKALWVQLREKLRNVWMMSHTTIFSCWNKEMYCFFAWFAPKDVLCAKARLHVQTLAWIQQKSQNLGENQKEKEGKHLAQMLIQTAKTIFIRLKKLGNLKLSKNSIWGE